MVSVAQREKKVENMNEKDENKTKLNKEKVRSNCGLEEEKEVENVKKKDENKIK